MGTAKEILEKHGIKVNKSKKVESEVSRRARHKAAVDKLIPLKPQKTAEQEVVARVVANDKAAQEKTTAFVASLHPIKEGSRGDLMSQAKAKGIKYFRILSKADLHKVLDPDTIQQEIDSIIDDAKKRWKAGWGSKKKEPVNVTA